jgi:hypothetical protein
MSVINSQPLIGASGNQGGAYNLTKSLRFRGSASAHLTRTPASSGNARTWTFSSWVKIGSLAAAGAIYSSGTNVNTGNGVTEVSFQSDNTFAFTAWQYINGTIWRITTNAIQRDPAAWYHLVVAVDTTQATASNRVKLYINGVQQTSLYYSVYPSQNYDTGANTTDQKAIGKRINYTEQFDGYLSEYHFIDGQALTPSSFGETSTTTGVWIPKRYAGTYGTNGFYLDFEDTSSVAALGYDAAGSNDWTVNNISLTSGTTYDSMTDVPTLTSATAANYAVGNPLSVGANTSLSNGNLSGTLTGSGGWSATFGGFTSGKWYYEATVTATTINSIWIGWISDAYRPNDNAWSSSSSVLMYGNLSGNKGDGTAYGATYTTNDVIGVALDLDNGTIVFYKNGTSQGTAFSSINASAVWRPLISGGGTGTTIAMNFGQRPFAYTPPSGFVALNTFNLPTPTIGATASTQANKYMDATTFTANGGTQTVVNAGGFKPDLIWNKARSTTSNNWLANSIAGPSYYLRSNLTDAEVNDATLYTSFNSNGYTLGSGNMANGTTMVGWQWQAGQGTTSSNTQGTITSTVSANTSAGFSIVTWTGTGANATVGHGLGVAPSMIIAKCRSNADWWPVYHSSLGGTKNLRLDDTTAVETISNIWNNTAPTSSVFSIGTSTETGASSRTYVAYCFAEVAGYSKFGSYTGNGSTDGAFVFTGFRPKFVMVKRTDSTGAWYILDTSINSYNEAKTSLQANSSAAEVTDANFLDILSNGFKLRTSGAAVNGSGATYIYMAFAETPQKFAIGR